MVSTGVLKKKNNFQRFKYITKNLVISVDFLLEKETGKNPVRMCFNSLNHGKTSIMVKSAGLKYSKICAYCYMSYARTGHEFIMYLVSAKFNLSC